MLPELGIWSATKKMSQVFALEKYVIFIHVKLISPSKSIFRPFNNKQFLFSSHIEVNARVDLVG